MVRGTGVGSGVNPTAMRWTALGLIAAWCLPTAAVGVLSLVDNISLGRDNVGDPEFWPAWESPLPNGLEDRLVTVGICAFIACLLPGLVLGLVALWTAGRRRAAVTLGLATVIGALACVLAVYVEPDQYFPWSAHYIKPAVYAVLPLVVLGVATAALGRKPRGVAEPALTGSASAAWRAGDPAGLSAH